MKRFLALALLSALPAFAEGREGAAETLSDKVASEALAKALEDADQSSVEEAEAKILDTWQLATLEAETQQSFERLKQCADRFGVKRLPSSAVVKAPKSAGLKGEETKDLSQGFRNYTDCAQSVSSELAALEARLRGLEPSKDADLNEDSEKLLQRLQLGRERIAAGPTAAAAPKLARVSHKRAKASAR